MLLHGKKLAVITVLLIGASGCNGGGGELVIPSGMVHVKPGSFKMGFDGKDAMANERPVRMAEVKDGFFMDQYEVTNEQFFNFCTATNQELPKQLKGKVTDGKLAEDVKHLPVVNVSFGDAEAYAKYYKKRIPTEEEWEFASRGPTSFLYPWGNEWKKGLANNFEEKHNGPVKVGTYASGKGPFGAFDQSGNVWEWTTSLAQQGSSIHIIKGGSFEALEQRPRASLRGQADAGTKKNNLGFRCVRDL